MLAGQWPRQSAVTPKSTKRLMRFDFALVHVPGKLLYTADLLSWSPQEGKAQESKSWNDLHYEVECYVNAALVTLPASDPHPKPLIRVLIILQAVLVKPKGRGCTLLFVVDKSGPTQPSGWLVPLFCCCHHEDFAGAHTFYGEQTLAYPQPQFLDMSGRATKASPTIFEKCGGKLAWEGRDATPWDPYGIPHPNPFERTDSDCVHHMH